MALQCPFLSGRGIVLLDVLVGDGDAVAGYDGGVNCPPFERTACHSSSDFCTGKDMSLDEELEELKRLPRNGMVGIDFKTVTRVRGWRAL
jgi:hypothetical protein